MVDQDSTNMQFELNYKKATISKSIVGKSAPLGKLDYIKKSAALDFHPCRNTVAVASLNCFFLYSMWLLFIYWFLSIIYSSFVPTLGLSRLSKKNLK